MWKKIKSSKSFDLVWFGEGDLGKEEIVCISKEYDEFRVVYYGYSDSDFWTSKEKTVESALFISSLKLFENGNKDQKNCFELGLKEYGVL
jgi:hypothetical protein